MDRDAARPLLWTPLRRRPMVISSGNGSDSSGDQLRCFSIISRSRFSETKLTPCQPRQFEALGRPDGPGFGIPCPGFPDLCSRPPTAGHPLRLTNPRFTRRVNQLAQTPKSATETSTDPRFPPRSVTKERHHHTPFTTTGHNPAPVPPSIQDSEGIPRSISPPLKESGPLVVC